MKLASIIFALIFTSAVAVAEDLRVEQIDHIDQLTQNTNIADAATDALPLYRYGNPAAAAAWGQIINQIRTDTEATNLHVVGSCGADEIRFGYRLPYSIIEITDYAATWLFPGGFPMSSRELHATAGYAQAPALVQGIAPGSPIQQPLEIPKSLQGRSILRNYHSENHRFAESHILAYPFGFGEESLSALSTIASLGGDAALALFDPQILAWMPNKCHKRPGFAPFATDVPIVEGAWRTSLPTRNSYLAEYNMNPLDCTALSLTGSTFALPLADNCAAWKWGGMLRPPYGYSYRKDDSSWALLALKSVELANWFHGGFNLTGQAPPRFVNGVDNKSSRLIQIYPYPTRPIYAGQDPLTFIQPPLSSQNAVLAVYAQFNYRECCVSLSSLLGAGLI